VQITEKLSKGSFIAVTIKEAYKILGLPAGAGFHEVKKKYRKLMMQVHPDVNGYAGQQMTCYANHPYSEENYAYNAQEINTAYSTLKEKHFTSVEKKNCGPKNRSAQKQQTVMWNAPVNKDAYTDREVLQYVTDYDGTVLGNFCVAKGKYWWTKEEDF